MKIQEMGPASTHLSRKVGTARPENVIQIKTAATCELDERRWAVVSFDKREADSLSYGEAAGLMSVLAARGVKGLCVVTDATAERVS